jgi:uncharacterized protein
MKQWEITSESDLPNLNKPIFIEGLPGIGNVGKIAVDFLVDELGAKKLYSFFSHKFPHSVFVNHENIVELPKLEIYYKKYNGKSKKRDMLILVGDIQPIDEESCYTFCEEILKIIKHFKATELITLGGIGLQAIPEKPKVYCTSNNKSLLTSYTKKGSGVQKNIFGVVGPIIGVSGILLGLAQRRKVKGVALLAETFAHPMYLGIKGAKELLRVIDKKHDYKLNIKKLSKEIIAIEQELMNKTQEWATEVNSHEAGAKLKRKEVSYIG